MNGLTGKIIKQGNDMSSDLAVEVTCAHCGSTLNATCSKTGELLVEPCESCMDGAYEDGRSEGYEEGANDSE